MTHTRQLSYLAALISALLLTGCGDAETNIVEKDPIEAPGDDHDHGDDDDHDDDHDHGEESLGRLAILSADSNEAAIFSLDDSALMDTFPLTFEGSSITASANHRYAVISARADDHVEFIDGGLWQEDHVDHLHDYKEAPAFSDYSLSGSRPTHVVKHDGQMAVFFDGDADSSSPAKVTVLTDNDIAAAADSLPMLQYTVNMHGVAEPRGEYLLASVRRADAETTSANPVLPDQVGVYHLHDGTYEQEQILADTCPDLHGASQNEEYVVFGCSDGVLVAHQHDAEFESVKIANIDALASQRVGSIYGHHAQEGFIGVASSHGGGAATLVSINPHEGEMEAVEWSSDALAHPVSYAFSHDGEHFLILDNQGYLSVLSAHAHGDHSHWEVDAHIDISEEDAATMPEGQSFTMAVAQNGHHVYIGDPLASQVIIVDLEAAETVGELELDFVPAGMSWLGIPVAQEEHDH